MEISIYYKNGEFEDLDIRHAWTHGLINSIINDSYLQIGTCSSAYRCVNYSYYQFEEYIKKFDK